MKMASAQLGFRLTQAAGCVRSTVIRSLSTRTTVEASPNHIVFQAPVVTYTPFIPGGIIEGTVAPGWEPVREAFAQNFAKGLEKGSQLVIRVDGTNVVDLSGYGPSCTTTQRDYDANTLQNIYR